MHITLTYRLLSTAILCLSLNFSPATAGPASQITSIIKSVKDGMPLEALCSKADTLKAKFTLRSFRGKLCKIKYVASFAMMLCKDKNDFNNSRCYKYATNSVGSQNPSSVLGTALDKKEGKSFDLVCGLKDKLPGALKTLADSKCK